MNQVQIEVSTLRALDAEVAEKIMGLKVLGVATCTHIEGEWDVATTWNAKSSWATQEPVYVPLGHDFEPCDRCMEPENELIGKFQGYSDMCLEVVPFFASDMRAAMQVVEKLRELGWNVGIADSEPDEGDTWNAEFYRADGPRRTACGFRPTLPEAICRAALKTIESRPLLIRTT